MRSALFLPVFLALIPVAQVHAAAKGDATAKGGAVAPSQEVRGERVTPADMAALPPVCRLIMENPGIHHTVGQTKNAALFERAEYQMAKGNIHVHHYCWALISKQRYFRESSKLKRDAYFKTYLGDLNYVFEHSPKDWPFFDVLHLEQASTHLIRGDFAKGIQQADEALRLNPQAEKAYTVKSDAYKEMGKKALAIKTAQEGLDKNPASTVLRKRLAKLGVAPPPLPKQADAPKDAAPTKDALGNADDGASRADAAAATETQADDASAAAVDAPAAASADAGATDASAQKPNPYCRFCP
jgi:tetratricopeptide (TPR) repeat protein